LRHDQRKRALMLRVLTAALFAVLLPSAAIAEYRLDVGDVVEVSSIGIPGLKFRSKVNPDGQISFPLLGQMRVAGETLSRFREQVQRVLPSKLFRQKSEGGREEVVVIDPDQLFIDIVEYRPIYVNGDVAKPGEQTYRAGLTVLQAIALSGGYDMMHFRMENPFLQSADLQSEYNTLTIEFVKEQAHVLRLKAQLDGKPDFDRTDLTKAPMPRQIMKQIVDLEAQQLAARDADYAKDRIYLKSALDEADRQFTLLQQQQRQEKEETAADASDMQRLRGLVDNGLAQAYRVSDQRRSMQLSQMRFLQTSVQITQMMRERGELGRKLQRLDDQRRLEALQELQNAEVKLATIRSKIQAVGEKLLYSGTIKSQLVRGTGGKPSISISRKEGAQRTRVPGNDDTELLPGDVVEVTLRAEYDPDMGNR